MVLQLLKLFELAVLIGLSLPSLTQTSTITASINPIGGNVDAIDYRGRTQMFVNLVRQAQPFMQLKNHSQTATVDINGWPTEPFRVDLQTLGTDMEGDYMLACIGSGQFASLADGVIKNQEYDVVTGITSAPLSITSTDASDIAISFDGGAGATNLTVMLPGFTATDADAFNPLYITQLQRFSTLRFLALLPINRDFIKSWDQRSRVENSPSYSNFCCPLARNDSSIPWEVAIDFANAVGSDVWLNLPVTANDDYYMQLAMLLKQRLEPSINVYIEFGNELWNGGFPSAYILKELANTSVTSDGDPYKLTYDHCINYTVCGNLWEARLAAYNVGVRLPSIFAKVFSPSGVGRGKRIRPILAGQSDFAKFIETQLTYLDTTHPNAVTTLHALSVAFYFNLGKDRNTENLSEAQCLADLNATLNANDVNYYSAFAEHAVVATWFGVAEVLGCESG